jgi:hypothetical protein
MKKIFASVTLAAFMLVGGTAFAYTQDPPAKESAKMAPKKKSTKKKKKKVAPATTDATPAAMTPKPTPKPAMKKKLRRLSLISKWPPRSVRCEEAVCISCVASALLLPFERARVLLDSAPASRQSPTITAFSVPPT